MAPGAPRTPPSKSGALQKGLSLTHRLWRALPAGPRRRALSQITAALAPRPDANPPPPQGGLAVGGELSLPSGLGTGARLMLAALQRIGIKTVALDFGDPIRRYRRRFKRPPYAMPMVLHINAPMLPLALLQARRNLQRGRMMIGYWAWELPTVPDAWRPGLDFVHEIWTPSKFTADALQGFAPHKTIRVVPHPVAIAPPVPSALTRADFGLPIDAVITLVSFSLASSMARKNPLAAIAAHRAAFQNRPDRQLVVKVAHADAHLEDFLTLRRAAAGADNIRFETRLLPQADSHALTACADIVLSLHRSEGFGLIPAEAMLLGIPVVATNWSATTEFMDETSACLVDYDLIPAKDARGVFEAPGAMWAEARVEDAAAHLQRLANDPALRQQIGAAGKTMAQSKLDDAPLQAALAAINLPQRTQS